MLFWVIVKVGLKSLWANKLRTLLAMLGIIIGVGAVISMLAVGAGARAKVMAGIYANGTNLLVVRPGQNQSHGVMSGTQQNLSLEDAEAILAEAKGVAAVAPVVSNYSQVKYLSKNTRVNVIGSSVTFAPIRNFILEKGRTFTDGEVENSGRVAILGPMTATNLFEEGDPLGQIIKIQGVNFRVVGVLKSKGDQGWYNPDDQVIVPYSTGMKQLFGVEFLREIDVQGKETEDLVKLQDTVTQLLRKRHRTQDGAPEDFSIRNQADAIQQANDALTTFNVLLGSIASISLVVGGIGIMNIMLVSVTERTREIGIRMAIGAKRGNVLTQFLIESMIITGLGGVLGAGGGVAAAYIIAKFSTAFTALVEVQNVVMAVAFSAGVGIIFGLYPAWRAASLDPVEALRYE